MNRSTALVLALAMAAFVAPLPAWAEEQRRDASSRALLGLSELEIRRRMGRPASVRGREWVYAREVAGTLESELVIRFARGHVTDAFERRAAIRCELVER